MYVLKCILLNVFVLVGIVDSPLLREEHSIWQTLMEKLLAKEEPLVTTVNVTGLLEDKPMSTYTEK